MRTKITETKVYRFDELTEEQKDKAIEKLYDINVDFDWWRFTYEDAETIGLKIEGFDLYRGSYCNGKFMESAYDVAMLIKENHGEQCETYKTANDYLITRAELESETSDKEGIDFDPDYLDTEDIDNEFLKSLCEDYRIMLQHEYDYQTSREAIIETIDANEYEFDEEGNIA